MKKLAVFYFSFAYDSGHPYGMDYAKEITENENIYVDFNAIVGWAQKEGIVDKLAAIHFSRVVKLLKKQKFKVSELY